MDLGTIQIVMMMVFIVALILGIWKIYAFLPNKPLADDDTTPEAVALLEKIMVETDSNYPKCTEEDLYLFMQGHKLFDEEKFWRFNQNRLRQLIINYRFKEPSFRA